MSDGLSLDQQQQVCAQSAGQHGDKTLRLIEKKISCLSATGFSIEGGTRRLIAAYFGIYSRLLCV